MNYGLEKSTTNAENSVFSNNFIQTPSTCMDYRSVNLLLYLNQHLQRLAISPHLALVPSRPFSFLRFLTADVHSAPESAAMQQPRVLVGAVFLILSSVLCLISGPSLLTNSPDAVQVGAPLVLMFAELSSICPPSRSLSPSPALLSPLTFQCMLLLYYFRC